MLEVILSVLGIMTESDEERGARRPSYSNGEEDDSVSSSDDVDGDDDDDDDDDGEWLDFVSELTPLFAGGHHPRAGRRRRDVVDVDNEHCDDDGRVDGRRSTTRLQRKLSDDDSIHTVTALPDMEIRCHSINGAIHRRPGHCVIRPSTTKMVSEWEEAGGIVSALGLGFRLEVDVCRRPSHQLSLSRIVFCIKLITFIVVISLPRLSQQ